MFVYIVVSCFIFSFDVRVKCLVLVELTFRRTSDLGACTYFAHQKWHTKPIHSYTHTLILSLTHTHTHMLPYARMKNKNSKFYGNNHFGMSWAKKNLFCLIIYFLEIYFSYIFLLDFQSHQQYGGFTLRNAYFITRELTTTGTDSLCISYNRCLCFENVLH